MKATISNILDESVELKDLELEFTWVILHFIKPDHEEWTLLFGIPSVIIGLEQISHVKDTIQTLHKNTKYKFIDQMRQELLQYELNIRGTKIRCFSTNSYDTFQNLMKQMKFDIDQFKIIDIHY